MLRTSALVPKRCQSKTLVLTLLLGMVWTPLAGLAQSAQIVVGEHALFRDTPGQLVSLQVQGALPISGVNLSIISGDGFPDLPNSSIDGPKLVAVDLIGEIGPTILSANSSGQQDPGSRPQVAFRSATTRAQSVTADGILCHLVIDTTGVAPGRYALRLSGDSAIGLPPTQLLDSSGAPQSVSIEDGILVVEDAVGPTVVVTAPEVVEAGSAITVSYLVKTIAGAEGATVLVPFPENATWLGRGPAFEAIDDGILWDLGALSGAAKLTATLELEPGSAQYPVLLPRARLALAPSGRVALSAPASIDVTLSEAQLVQVILEEIPTAPAFDLNQDGAVDVLDLVTHTHETHP